MIIRCWGARGSIAVSGQEYLKYGGDTACIEIRTKNDEIIIVDAGTGIRRLGNRLLHEGRTSFHMLITHAHWDHLMGFPFFKPLYQKNARIIFHGNPLPEHSIEAVLSETMKNPLFPVEYGSIAGHLQYEDLHRDDIAIDSVTVSSLPLSHPNQGMGYIFREGDKKFVFLTDNELTYNHPGSLEYEGYVAACAGADLLIHDAEFTSEEYKHTRRWGHTTYNDAVKLALEANVKMLGLFHHNQDRSDDALDSMVDECRKVIEVKGIPMECCAITQFWEMVL